MISFFVEGLAETKGSWIPVARGVLRADNKREAPWSEIVGWHAKLAMRGQKMITGRVAIDLYFTLPKPPNKTKKNRRDGDKLERSVFDALTGIVYSDDELIDRQSCEKRIAEPGQRLGVAIFVQDHPGHDPTDPGWFAV